MNNFFLLLKCVLCTLYSECAFAYYNDRFLVVVVVVVGV